ncbi:MAG: hypothetical protein K6E10_08905 [Eubacterium sp.]|nr:hypothetical protein [Eubacterium sp.]
MFYFEYMEEQFGNHDSNNEYDDPEYDLDEDFDSGNLFFDPDGMDTVAPSGNSNPYIKPETDSKSKINTPKASNNYKTKYYRPSTSKGAAGFWFFIIGATVVSIVGEINVLLGLIALGIFVWLWIVVF